MQRHKPKRDGKTGASWFVSVVDQAADTAAEERFAAWLDEKGERQDELARCETSIYLATQLASDSELRWAFAEAAALAHAPARQPDSSTHWLRKPALAWTVAGVSALAAVLAILQDRPFPAGADRLIARYEAAEPLVPLASIDPVVELPGHVLVDAHSLAVLPFTGSGGESPGRPGHESLAKSMHAGLIGQLSTIPGFYVIGRESVQPYQDSDMRLEEIAAHLGVRGIVQADITPVSDRVRISLRLTDAATHEVVFQSVYERPRERLSAMDAEMASTIALALSRSAQPPRTRSTHKGEIT